MNVKEELKKHLDSKIKFESDSFEELLNRVASKAPTSIKKHNIAKVLKLFFYNFRELLFTEDKCLFIDKVLQYKNDSIKTICFFTKSKQINKNMECYVDDFIK